MFWGGKNELHALRQAYEALQQREQRLMQELETAKRAVVDQQNAALEKDRECETLKNVVRSLSSFGATLAGSQSSLGAMANVLHDEKMQAVEAAEVALLSGQATTEIASNLHQLAEDSAKTAHEVESLALQADKIGSIVQRHPSQFDDGQGGHGGTVIIGRRLQPAWGQVDRRHAPPDGYVAENGEGHSGQLTEQFCRSRQG